MKKYIYPMALTATLLATAACSDDEVNDIQQGQDLEDKEMISFSMSDGSKSTEAITRVGFEKATSILMRIQSDDRRTTSVDGVDPQTTLYTRTAANATANTTKAGGFQCSDVTFDAGYTRYWDDAYGRYGQLSVYAVAVPTTTLIADQPVVIAPEKLKDGTGNASTTNVKTWGTSDDNTIVWTVEKDAQTPILIDKQDLCYSNNIQADGTLGKKGVYKYDFTKKKHIPDLAEAVTSGNDFSDGRMLFRQAGDPTPLNSDAGKFDKGHMDFKHSLSRMTIHLIEGDGFDSGSSADFQFTKAPDASAVSNIKLINVPYTGTLNIKTGEWSNPSSASIAKLAAIGKSYTSGVFSGSYTDASGYYRAQFLPGYEIGKTSTTNVFTFTIDNNTYYITQKMIFEALTATGATLESMSSESNITMEQGKNYCFDITVKKTKIESITATLVNWVDATAANETATNSYVTLSLSDETGTACEDFDIYRLPVESSNILTDQTSPTADAFVNKVWAGDYTDVAKTSNSTLSMCENYETSKQWQTTWFFKDNKTFYHFRTVKAGTTINTTPAKDNFTITSGAVASTDPHWGAPMTSGANFAYYATEENDANGVTKEGYSSSIYKAIGSTKDNIAIKEIHMMANVKVILKTVTGDGAVKLYDGSTASTVTITQFANSGTVDMGTGFVRPTAPFTQNQAMTIPGTNESTYYQTASTTSKEYSWAVVPQTLKRGDADADYIGITIQTPDHNQYYVVKRLSEILPSSVQKGGIDYADPNQAKTDPITFWYPGHQYIYTFTISKKGIESITCTVADWIDVVAANKDITLED